MIVSEIFLSKEKSLGGEGGGGVWGESRLYYLLPFPTMAEFTRHPRKTMFEMPS